MGSNFASGLAQMIGSFFIAALLVIVVVVGAFGFGLGLLVMRNDDSAVCVEFTQ